MFAKPSEMKDWLEQIHSAKLALENGAATLKFSTVSQLVESFERAVTCLRKEAGLIDKLIKLEANHAGGLRKPKFDIGDEVWAVTDDRSVKHGVVHDRTAVFCSRSADVDFSYKLWLMADSGAPESLYFDSEKYLHATEEEAEDAANEPIPEPPMSAIIKVRAASNA